MAKAVSIDVTVVAAACRRPRSHTREPAPTPTQRQVNVSGAAEQQKICARAPRATGEVRAAAAAGPRQQCAHNRPPRTWAVVTRGLICAMTAAASKQARGAQGGAARERTRATRLPLSRSSPPSGAPIPPTVGHYLSPLGAPPCRAALSFFLDVGAPAAADTAATPPLLLLRGRSVGTAAAAADATSSSRCTGVAASQYEPIASERHATCRSLAASPRSATSSREKHRPIRSTQPARVVGAVILLACGCGAN